MAKLKFVKIGTSLLLNEMSTLHPLNSAFESPRSDDPVSVSGSSRDAIRVPKPVSKKIEIMLEFPRIRVPPYSDRLFIDFGFLNQSE